MRFYKDILIECPKCKSNKLIDKTFETGIEGVYPYAILDYECEDCHCKWRLTLKPTKIELL